MFEPKKFLPIVLIFLVTLTQNSFATLKPDTFTFYGKGKVKQSSSFAGKIVRTITYEAIPKYEIHANFDSRHGSYGDRTDQIVTQVIAPHLMVITVSDGKVISVIIDDTWDEINQKLLSP